MKQGLTRGNHRFLQTLPTSVMNSVYPKGISNMMLGKTGQQNIEKIKAEIASSKEDLSGVSVFHHLLSADIPESEKSTDRLRAESMIMLLAGTLAAAHTLTFVVFYVLQNPKIEKRLRAELQPAFKDYPNKMPRWADLEKLPYLRGCIKEALRLNGLVGNLARCSPDEDIRFNQWVIPKKVRCTHHSHLTWAAPPPFFFLIIVVVPAVVMLSCELVR